MESTSTRPSPSARFISPASFRRFLLESGLIWVALGFGGLTSLNLASLLIGPMRVLEFSEHSSFGIVSSLVIFDSWGTIGGLLGVVVLFVPVLLGVPKRLRRPLSLYYVAGSLSTGVASSLIWDRYFDTSGTIGSGSSSIAIAAQAILFTFSVAGLARLLRMGKQRERPDNEILDSFFFGVVYVTLIVTTLVFVLLLQPIFVPTLLYNWRAHEIGFFIAIGATTAYESVGSLLSSRRTLSRRLGAND